MSVCCVACTEGSRQLILCLVRRSAYAMIHSRTKLICWIAAGVAALGICLFALVWLTVPRDYPDEAQARRDFLAEHPSFVVERVTIDEQEVVAACFRIFYRAPGDSTIHEEFRQYLHTAGEWRITHRTARR